MKCTTETMPRYAFTIYKDKLCFSSIFSSLRLYFKLALITILVNWQSLFGEFTTEESSVCYQVCSYFRLEIKIVMFTIVAEIG